METRRRKLKRRQDSQESRDSSVSSSSREVRCGCQYFQSDSLLPERQSLVGTRPSSRNMNIGEHEYEPINPIASPQPPPPPVVRVTDMEGAVKSTGSDVSSNDSRHQQFLRIPLHDEVVEDEVDEEEEEEEEAGDSRPNSRPTTAEGEDIEKEDRILRDERFFAATPTTTESRTDGEINTSQVDSSGLDELPLKKDARRANDVRGIQQRIRSQAGRIRTKLRNMSRPRINLPERPKFSFPEKAKINLPERPKFHLPERPKFNFPQRPKISMPNFSFGKTKTNSVRRPLRDRNQAHSSQSSTGGKKNIFDTFRTYPRIFSKKRRASLNETQGKGKRAQTPPPRMETEESAPSTPASRTGTFGQRWTTRYKDIKFADDENQSASQSDKQKSFDDDVEDDSAPFRDTYFGGAVTLEDHKPKCIKAGSSDSVAESDKEQRSSGTSSERHRAGVLEEIDSDEFFLREKGLSREDVDVSRYLSLEIRDAFRKPKNALARLDTELYDEDIDYDFEPTVKMPGEPFRRSMEAMRRESLEPIRMTPEPEDVYESEHDFEDKSDVEDLEPVRPTRTRSLRHRSQRSKSEEAKHGSSFNTFPPSRPNRGRKKSDQTDKQSIETAEANIDDNIEENRLQTNPASIHSLAVTDTTHDISPSRYIDESSEALNHHWHPDYQPPLPPKRRRSTKDLSQDNRSLSNSHYANEKWIEEVEAQIIVPGEVTALSMEIVNDVVLRNGYYDSPPMPPIRKQRSRGTSLADEDRTSRGADSLISETRDPDEQYEEEIMADVEPEPQSESKPTESEVIREQHITVRDNYDYAVVEKTIVEKTVTHVTPQRPSQPKPTHPPLPGRKERAAQHISNFKNQGINFFFTYPRRAIRSLQREAPVRPLRNYSTVGHNNNRERPARPPRRSRVFREPVYAEGEIIPLKGENEQDKNEENELVTREDRTENVKMTDVNDDLKDSTVDYEDTVETRDLQSGDVIEKMKGRPLPPPPRPPRKSKDDLTHQTEFNEETGIQVTDLDEPEEGDIILERIQFQIVPDNTSQPALTKVSSQTTVHSDTVSDKVHLKDNIDSETVQIKEERVSEAVKLKNNVLSETTYPQEGVSDTAFLKQKQKIVDQTVVNEPPVKTERKRKSLSSVKTSEVLKETRLPKQVQPTLEEVTTATQTDPLPEGLVIEDVQQTIASDSHQQESTTEIKAEASHPPPEVLPPPSTIPERIIQTVLERTVIVTPDSDTEIECLKTKKLQVSELDVEKLNVTELQAQKITVSDIEGITMQVSELTSRGGNLIVSGIEIPPTLLQSLMSQQPPAPSTPPQPTVIIRECMQQSTQTTPPPVTVNSQTNTSPECLPEKIEFPSSAPISSTSQKPEKTEKEMIQHVQQPSSAPTSSTSQKLVKETIQYVQQSSSAPISSSSQKPEKVAKETIQYVQQPPSIVVESLDGQSSQVFVPDHIATTPQITKIHAPQKTRAHVSTTQPIPGFESQIEIESRQTHHHSLKNSQFPNSVEESSDIVPSFNVSQHSHERDVTATDLIRQLIRIWQNNFVQGMDRVIETLNSAFPEGEKRRDAQTAACIVLILILLLMIVGIGSDKTVHIHHWDYVPPRL